MEMTPLRINILAIAFLIALVCLGIIILLGRELGNPNANDFVLGALIGLLGTGLTGLAGLGTTLINDVKSEKKRDEE